MPLSAGDKIGPYEIVSLLGKGGMGAVWKAHDPRLGRDVAIKILAKEFSDRFEREARTIAALNHSNICMLHDVAPDYLVMELIEGPTLAERLAQGAVPLEEALSMAKQIADALGAAHEKGIVHRDLKPANIKIRPDGSVKVLDFGLAKTGDLPVVTPDSPTMMPGTEVGMILGTAGYMSPEQARGKDVDKRADIWAFGVVLYEMLSGERLFRGETVSDTLAAVLTGEPDLKLVPAKTRRLLESCLEKDVNRRLRDIGDAILLIGDSGAPRKKAISWVPWTAAAVFAIATTTLVFVQSREKPAKVPVLRSTVVAPEKTAFRFDVQPFGVPALSPDGTRLVFSARSQDGVSRLWIRPLDSMTAQPVGNSEEAYDAYPFWSPDGASIAFHVGSELRKLDSSGGSPIALAQIGDFRGGSWSPEGVILFAKPTGGLQRISVAGGDATTVTALDQSRKETSHQWPWFLPDGHHFIYTAVSAGRNDVAIYISSLGSHESRIVTQANSNAAYASGYLLFLRGNTLMAQPFDTKRFATTGEAIPVVEQVDEYRGRTRASFTVSNTGTLVFQSQGRPSQSLVWLDRSGKRLARVGEPAPLGQTSLAPDGRRAIASVFDDDSHAWNLWSYDLVRDLRSRFTLEPVAEQSGVWSHDGTQIVFASNSKGPWDIYRKPSSGAGAPELLYADGENKSPMSWSPDDKFVLYSSPDKTGQHLWVLPVEGGRKPFSFLKTGFQEGLGQFSPDGRWVAYVSTESAQSEIYVAPFPGARGKWLVSVAGGTYPRWRADGKELFYVAPDKLRTLMVAEVDTKPAAIKIGAVRPLFGLGPLQTGVGFQYDASADGQRFLAVIDDEQSVAEPLTLVQNWTDALKPRNQR
jgi:Tol biopolymer transport system component